VVNFGRVLTAMITPFSADGSVNYGVTERLAAHLADNGTDSLVVCGTTGESPTLTWDEEYQLFQVVQKAVAGKAKVIAGTGSNSTQEAIAATEKAAKLGIDGSLQVVPYYNKPPQSGLYHHFEAIAKACPDMPLILYNVPSRTGQNLQAETVARLSEIPNIVGIKEASGNFEQASQIRRLTPPDFAIYSGSGVVSVASHLVGSPLQEMIQAFEAGKTEIAKEIHLKLFPLFKVLFCTANPIPLKAALKLQGWDVGSPRPPLCDLPTELKEGLEKVLIELSLL
jgi:4-hydroxy-tetrahydrodipicolinate synthase